MQDRHCRLGTIIKLPPTTTKSPSPPARRPPRSQSPGRSSLTFPRRATGNHDITLDAPFYAQHSTRFHNQSPQDAHACRQLLRSPSSITYLENSCAQIRLTRPSGPQTTFTVFGSPYSPAHNPHGLWAFGDSTPAEASMRWESIPLDTDIVVTHTPPRGWCDEAADDERRGCAALRQRLWRVRPKLAVCGHVHGGRGVERVRWDLTSSSDDRGPATGTGMSTSTRPWTTDDSGGDKAKACVVDLSLEGGEPLDHSGSTDESSTGGDKKELPLSVPVVPGADDPDPFSRRRMGRRETCVINAAMLASRRGGGRGGGRRYHGAIVVDLELATWPGVSASS